LRHPSAPATSGMQAIAYDPYQVESASSRCDFSLSLKAKPKQDQG
jgi:hypothetical protein